METYTIALAIGFLFFTAKMAIDLYALIAIIKKDKVILSQDNELDEDYEFIKGLH